jgi:hypothetical protein
MKAIVRIGLLGCLVLILLVEAEAQVPPQVSPFSADMSYSGIAHGSRPARDFDGKLYFAQGHIRMDIQGGGPAGPGGQNIIITNFKDQVTDILLPAQHVYMEHKMGEGPAARRGGLMPSIRPFRDPSNPCAEQEGWTCKNLGTEQVNGRDCDHWQITDKNGKVNNTWVDQKLYFPIKNVSEDGTWELTNIQEGEPAASLFQIPAGYTKMDMGNMMGGMAGPPQR